MSLPTNNADSPTLKSSLSIKKGLESLNLKKTITFATENAENMQSSSASKRKSPKKRKPSQKEILAAVEPRYLSNTTISTLAKREVEKRFHQPSEAEIKEKMEKYEKLQEKVTGQRKKIRENGDKLKEKTFLSYLVYFFNKKAKNYRFS